jgi:23S rRNA pseudouridine1911/1915/1917 synthase
MTVPTASDRLVKLAASVAGRLDRALADAAPEFSRARIQALIHAGALTLDGRSLVDPAARALPGLYRLTVPAPAPAEPGPESLPLTVLFEDEYLIVIDKAAGMSAHPAPGSETGTLVNALIHHCGASLSGIGGVARPGIVHRLDKNTSGVMVAAKTDVAHRRLATLFAAHDLERVYIALTRGAPARKRGEVATLIGRSARDRKKMAVVVRNGRQAVTRYEVERTFGARSAAARIACRLETGRTHQIRVHLAHLGAPCLGDPTYGAGGLAPALREAVRAAGLRRQALHAAVLGFRHPITGADLRFGTAPPADMTSLEAALAVL